MLSFQVFSKHALLCNIELFYMAVQFPYYFEILTSQITTN